MNTGTYVDGFVFTVPKKNISAYKEMARDAARAWKKFGALAYFECSGDELKTKAKNRMPAPLSFTKLTGATSTDTVWFSFIVYKNKKHRDVVNKQVMSYFEKKCAKTRDMTMPFDIRKMAYGGFRVVVRS